ncbi:MAG: recombinase RecT [Microbacterium ginsengisoli]|nr:recombinase RecT [Microbacterium ginsengisoli]
MSEVALPSSVRPDTWNADTAAMMEFAGLTWIEGVGDAAHRVFAPSGVMAAFIAACARTGLDPTAKQIYAAQMGGKWTVLVGIDGMRVVAQRTGQYDGQDPIEWLAAEDGQWTTVPPKAPYAARVAIYRKGVSRPLVQTVTLAEFGGRGGNWSQRPSHMLGIRAESHAFRRAFPMELAGLYTPEDFESDDVDTSNAPWEEREDWVALIASATTTADLAQVGARIAESGQGNDDIRAAYRARAAVLATEANTVDADVVDDQTPAEGEDASPTPPASPSAGTPDDYEAAASAEFDAAVARGEVTPGD